MTKNKQFELEQSLAALQKSYNLLSKENNILRDARNVASINYSEALITNHQLVSAIASLKKELDGTKSKLFLVEHNSD